MFSWYTSLSDGFNFDPKFTPLGSPHAVILSVFTYLAGALILNTGRRGCKPMNLGLLPVAHNIILCGGSAVMFIGTAFEIVKEYKRTGDSRFLFCLPPGFKVQGALYFWSYVYYLSKFYELLDTAILVLRGKGLNFLHVFHHAFVMVMAYLWLDQAQSLQTTGMLTNTGIHVIMYYYYFLVSIGYKPKWKRLVTSAQIVQFLFSFANLVPFLYFHLYDGGCSGVEALAFNAVFNFALIALFGDFFKRSYSKSKKESKDA
mmetsp:Transcript_38071/g.72988  ORF Transcript_38071/g.72988 Transcript_38071/m.72988 type:complete len:259 (-) Transcript_38071:297-1073(-)|eukprot:CAMPEP_0114259592 /NCGR_PEP_ID=MMETSP0058-20121206/19977_1 /TAXON_ID=36894 /ORGANISM="Pyramimonas parkeae, CCMP726" /LENGTH=258 /DNA_ID=CAMNT_0001374653 /DNA_START=46 /DNA_END=822 /DNA_ORIENTATION=-